MSPSRPLLVVTPTLGRSRWLDRTVASVAAFAGPQAAHVLVAPVDRLADLRQRYPHCNVVADTIARGVYPAINLGLIHAPSGDWRWFTWINDDDELLPGFAVHLQRALACDATRPDAPWWYGRVELRDGHDRSLGGLAVALNPTDLIPLLQSGISPLNQHGLLMPRAWVDRLGLLREDLRICADLDFWLRALAHGAAFRASPETLAAFRLRAGQLSGDVSKHHQEFTAVVNAVVPTRTSAARRALARARFRFGNAGVYFERVRRTGWKRGFDLLQQPAEKKS